MSPRSTSNVAAIHVPSIVVRISDHIPVQNDDFTAWAQIRQHRMEAVLDALLPVQEGALARLSDAMRYATLGGGKRVRPLLVFAAGELVGAGPAALEQAAAAVEMIHAYSLVHDDLPSMDNDVLRRGKPTCHVQFDEATALLVGDGLQARAFEILAAPGAAGFAPQQLERIRILAEAAGPQGMVGGQAIDMESTGQSLSREALENLHARKTGALIRASVLLGALCGQPPAPSARESLDSFARVAGILFQVVDDILDASASTELLGKTAGKDAEQNKSTYVTLLGLAQARRWADVLHAQARQSLAGFGQDARRLLEMVDLIASRQS